MKRIFISHASKDKYIIQSFVDDILDAGLGIDVNDIFCTTIDGTKIPSGNDWRNEIKKSLEESIITFLIITPHYKESEMCLNEMGAAWVLSGKTIPLFVEPINYDSVGILQEVKQVERLLDEKSLDRIKDQLQELLEIPVVRIKSDRWTDKKSSFLKKVKEHIKARPFESPVTKEQIEYLSDQVKTLGNENETLNSRLSVLREENTKLASLNADLKNSLSPADVAVFERQHLDLQGMDEFEAICERAKEALSKVSLIVRSIVFVNYSGKDMGINFYDNDSALRDASARDFIDDANQPDWSSTKIMRQILICLDELKLFIEENKENKNFIFVYENKYQYPLSLSNLGFWEEVLGLSNNYLY
jgi:hypothetical protein